LSPETKPIAVVRDQCLNSVIRVVLIRGQSFPVGPDDQTFPLTDVHAAQSIDSGDRSIVERTNQLDGFAIEDRHLHVLYGEIVDRAGIDLDAGE
jgi:hypothetical protein